MSIEDKILRMVPLVPYTTFKIGGPAHYFIQPESMERFGEAIEWALKRGIPYFVLGGGANVLVHDAGYDGLVIHTGKLDAIDVRANRMGAECGAAVDDLVEHSMKHTLTGLEFAAGLPGTVGGALFMNAKAYESDFSRIVRSVQVLKAEKKEVHKAVLRGRELEFSYKQSIFQKREFYVYRVDFELAEGEGREIRRRIDAIRKKRREAGQFSYPNAGCIFKNNYNFGKPTGQIIDELGLKGTRIGDAEVYPKHANFIINRGSATARDVFRLIRFVESEVEKKLSIKIEREINLIGPW